MIVQSDSPGSLAIPHQQKTWRTGDVNVLAKGFIGAAEALALECATLQVVATRR